MKIPVMPYIARSVQVPMILASCLHLQGSIRWKPRVRRKNYNSSVHVIFRWEGPRFCTQCYPAIPCLIRLWYLRERNCYLYLPEILFFCVLFNAVANCQEYECWWWMHMEQWWNNGDRGKMDLLGVTPVPVPLSTTNTPQTCHESNLGQILEGFLAKKWKWVIPIIILTMSCIMVMINWYAFTFLCLLPE